MRLENINDLLGGSTEHLQSPGFATQGGQKSLRKKASSNGANNDWMKKLDLDDKGSVRNTFANIRLIIANDIRTRGLFERNLLLNSDVYRSMPARLANKRGPMDDKHQIDGPLWNVADPTSGELVLDVHCSVIREMLVAPIRRGGWSLGKPSAADVREAIEIIARTNAFHPVRDYLESLKWDGTERVEKLFVDYLGADNDSYHRDTAQLTLLAAVTRTFEPGHKFDFVPVIEGGQGVRKSTFIESLAVRPMWAGALSSDFGNVSRMVESMQGRWIMELAEMSGMKRSDVDDIKKFVSETEDRVRLAYARNAENYPRRSIIIGSTNDDAYLRDDTGGRRFWPIRCQLERVGGSVPIDRLLLNLDQIWAEAVVGYRALRARQPQGPLPLYLVNEESKEQAARLQDQRKVSSIWHDWAAQIDEWADRPAAQGDGFTVDETFDRRLLSAPQIWSDCFGYTGKPSQQDSAYIGFAMKMLKGKWERSERITYPKGSSERNKYGRPRGWTRRLTKRQENE